MMVVHNNLKMIGNSNDYFDMGRYIFLFSFCIFQHVSTKENAHFTILYCMYKFWSYNICVLGSFPNVPIHVSVIIKLILYRDSDGDLRIFSSSTRCMQTQGPTFTTYVGLFSHYDKRSLFYGSERRRRRTQKMRE